MAIDRTVELLSFYNDQKSKTASPKEFNLKDSGPRNRHRKERFAVEDRSSPFLVKSPFSESDMERETPPATLIGMANSIMSDISEAERIVNTAIQSKGFYNDSIQQILGLCLKRIRVLQEQSERQSELRRGEEKGWLLAFRGGEKTACQLDQHEAVIVWFLHHKLSNVTKHYEQAKEEEGRKRTKAARMKQIYQSSISPRVSSTVAPSKVLPMEELTAMKPIEMTMTSETFQRDNGLSQEQMHELMHENDNLVKEYTEMQGQLDTTQASIQEIARLQTTLQEQLTFQASQIDRLFDDAATTGETVKRANAQLGQAASRQSTSVKFFIWFVFIASLFLLLLHAISD